MSQKHDHVEIIEFGRKKFDKSYDLLQKGNHCRFDIDPHWKMMGYLYPGRYPRSQRIEVLDWCSEHAPNAYIINEPGRAVLFKDETIATMFKLTFNEG